LMDGGRKNAEWLLHVLQDGVFMTAAGPETIPPITVVAATTDQGRLPSTITGRFIPTQLEPYSQSEAAKITGLKAQSLLLPHKVPVPTAENCVQIAEASNRNPRMITHMIRRLRDLVLTKQLNKGKNGYDLTLLLELQGLTVDGLDVRAQRMLQVMAEMFQGGPVSERHLQAQLGEPGGLEAVEKILIAKDYLKRTAQGRLLTPTGLARAVELLAS
jgi:holliday junction DNA helicase RuvB